MPFVLRKQPKKELYWVVNKETGKKHSKEGLPKETAEAQMRALYAAESGYTMKGSGIEMNLMQQMAQSAYKGKTKLQIGPFKLLTSTPTLKFYKDDKRIVVAVRGTDLGDKADLVADGLAITGNLRNSERWKKDEAKIKEVQEKFPKSEFRYIAVGHSLGGALIDLMLRDKLVQNALSYNPLVEPQELGGNPLHRRIYHKDDPLYQTFGRFIPNVEVRRTAEPFWKYYLKHNLPFGLGELFTLYDRHRIGRFKGGSKLEGGMTFNDFRRWWNTPLDEEAAERFRETGQLSVREQTRGDVALTALASILGIGGTGYAIRDEPTHVPTSQGTGSNFAPVAAMFAALAGSPLAGYALSKLTRMLPLPPTEAEEERAREQAQAPVMVNNPMRRVEQLERLRQHSRVGNVVPNMLMEDFLRPVRVEIRREEAEANVEEGTEPARVRRNTRVEFAPTMAPADDRNEDGKQDEIAYADEEEGELTAAGREIVFEDQLQELDYSPKKYLSKVRAKAKKAGYNPKQLSFCRDGIHKLQMETPDGSMVKFGRVGYGDFHIWSFLERNGKVEKGEAKKRRKLYLKRASKIKGDWKENEYSPNNLAMKILWS